MYMVLNQRRFDAHFVWLGYLTDYKIIQLKKLISGVINSGSAPDIITEEDRAEIEAVLTSNGNGVLVEH